MPNSVEFYKEIFLHVIPVRIIVPCLEARLMIILFPTFGKIILNVFIIKLVGALEAVTNALRIKSTVVTLKRLTFAKEL